MKKTIALISVLACMASVFTGCSVDIKVDPEEVNQVLSNPAVSELADKVVENIDLNINAGSATENKADDKKDSNSAAESQNSTTDSEDTSSSTQNSISEDENAPDKENAYEHPEDIRCEGVKAWKNADGTVKLEFEDGKFALTLPSVWDNHFIFDGVSLRAKIASERDGKLISMGFSEGCPDSIGWYSLIRGYSGNTYWTTHPVTDMRYNPDIKDEAEEYEMLRENMQFVYESRNDLTGKMETIVTIPDNTVKGFIDEYESGEIYGYTDSYINGSVSEAEGRNWTVEGGWHITVKRITNVPGLGTMYDCYDSDDGDHYGWINGSLFNDINK